MTKMAGQALAGRKLPLSGADQIAVPGAETEGAAVLTVFVAVVAAQEAEQDALLSDTPVDTGSAPVEASAGVVDSMSGAGLKPELEKVCPGPGPALLLNHARSECSTWRDLDSGCHNTDNA